jgi:hypothetical protein
MTIQVLFVNCRGVRKKGVASYIRDKMRDLNLDIICFQETILQDFSDACLRRIDPSRNYLWDWILA